MAWTDDSEDEDEDEDGGDERVNMLLLLVLRWLGRRGEPATTRGAPGYVHIHIYIYISMYHVAREYDIVK